MTRPVRVTPPGAPDVAVVGDGPAGLAIAASCRELGLDVVVHGSGDPWVATYATWRDDVPDLPDDVFASLTPRVEVQGVRRRVIDRTYGVFDGAALRAHLADGLTIRVGRVDVHAVVAGVVIDATGATGRPTSWQTAHGVVLAEVPEVLDVARDAVTLMDWRPAGMDWRPAGMDWRPAGMDWRPAGGAFGDGPPSFCYVVPVADGWLVEETVLAAEPAVEPDVLRGRLVRRLGAEGAALVDGAIRVEQVRIPMGSPPRRGAGPVVPFGAAAGFVHPATGYSVAASLRAAPRVAQAIVAGTDLGDAVWPRGHLRARALHDYGLDALLGLQPAEVATFFDAFFDLPVERWADYLRIDTTPGAVAGVMGRVFRRVPWRVRARLMTGDPRRVLRRPAAS